MLENTKAHLIRGNCICETTGPKLYDTESHLFFNEKQCPWINIGWSFMRSLGVEIWWGLANCAQGLGAVTPSSWSDHSFQWPLFLPLMKKTTPAYTSEFYLEIISDKKWQIKYQWLVFRTVALGKNGHFVTYVYELI